MSELDPSAARANEQGWSREALAADKKRQREEKAAKKKADGKAFRARVGNFLADCSDFMLRNLMLWLAIAGCLAIGAWEWINTSRGWLKLYPGVGFFIYVGAIGAVAGYFTSFWRWREGARMVEAAIVAHPGDENAADMAARPYRKIVLIWLSVTVASYLVCVAGVFIATATASQIAENEAKASRQGLRTLTVERNDLREQVELNDPELLQLAKDADERKLKALEGSARTTYDMPDLAVREPGEPEDKHGCPAPPKKFIQARLCAQANGGIDPFNGEVLEGIRIEIKRDELALKNALADVEKLAALDKQIADFHVLQGDETAAALGQMFTIEGGTVLSWLLLVLSSLFLYSGGWGADWVLETIEAKRKAAKERRSKPKV